MRFKIRFNEYSCEYDLHCIRENRIDQNMWVSENTYFNHRLEIERMQKEGTEPDWTHYFKWCRNEAVMFTQGYLFGDMTLLSEWDKCMDAVQLVSLDKVAVKQCMGYRLATSDEIYLYQVSKLVRVGTDYGLRNLEWVLPELRKYKIDRLLEETK